MPWSFDLFEEFGDVVEADTRTKRTQIPGLHYKRPLDPRQRSEQPSPERLVHYLPERPARAPRLGPELGSHVVVEGQRCAHIMMLSCRLHDVHASAQNCAS